MLPNRVLLANLSLFVLIAGCSRHQLATPAAAAISVPDNSYIDLQPGWTLRIVVPLLKSGSTGQNSTVVGTNGNTLVVRSKELIGYETSQYAIERARNGVRVEFLSAEVTRQGKTTTEAEAPALPFSLPRRAGHIRLIYLVRISRADHNMAIVESKRMGVLNDFTTKLKTDPNICGKAGEISCIWVPTGIAVRAEQP